MENNRIVPFNMDEQGLLKVLDRLIDRIGGCGPSGCDEHPGCGHSECAECDLLFGMSEDTYALIHEAFGNSPWTPDLIAAVLMDDAEMRRRNMCFLMGSRNVIRKYGMVVWLYEMVNDASAAMMTGRPSDRMPILLGLFDTREVFRKSDGKGRKYAGGKKKRHECLEGYLRGVYRFAASCLLQWGSDEPRAADTALMLLAYGGLGMCALREDANVTDFGCDPDRGYRNVCDQLRDLKVSSDFDYACNANFGDGQFAEYPECMDARYLYDARKLVESYRALWERETRSAARMLDEIERSGAHEVEDIWEDPVYLYDLAISLLGPNGACLLDDGFRLRDAELFEKGVHEVEKMAGNVERVGLLTTLAGYIFFCEPENRMDVLTMSRTEKRRMLDYSERLGEAAALIALYRLPRDARSLRSIRALLNRDRGAYVDEMGTLMGLADWSDGGMEESVPIPS